MRNLIATSAAILFALPVASQQLPDGTQFSNGPIMTAANGGSQTPTAACSSYNMGAKTTMGGGNSNVFATGSWVASAGQSVLGATVRTKAKSAAGGVVTVQLAIADAAGKPTAINMAKCSIKVTGTAFGNYSGQFAAPIKLKGGSRYALIHSGDGQVDHPRNADANAVKVAHYWRPPTGGTWSGPWTSVAWCIQARCTQPPQKTVSPVGYDTKEGNSNNTYPWYMPFRYMQGHGDLRKKPMLVKGQSHRRDGTLGNFTSAVARSTTCEIFVGETDDAKVTGTFATNWIGKPTSVFKGVVKQPDWVTKPVAAPAPFNFTIMYTTPAVYTGQNALTWECVITATTATTTYPGDAVSGGAGNSGPYLMVGKGCTASDQTRTMDLRCYFYTYGDKRVRHYCYCYGSFRDQPAVALMGFKNPNQLLPLCAATPAMKLYTDAVFSFPSSYAGKSRATDGYWNTGNKYFPYVTGMDKVTTWSQGASLDPKSKFGVTLSNGVSSSIAAPPPPPPPVYRVFARGAPTAASGSLGKGYALVTEFTH